MVFFPDDSSDLDNYETEDPYLPTKRTITISLTPEAKLYLIWFLVTLIATIGIAIGCSKSEIF